MKKFNFLLLVFALINFYNCSPTEEKVEQAEEDQLGVIEFDFSGSKEAEKAFKKGLLLLHNFEFESSKEAFLEAQKLDSNYVMAYWGEAMTYNHPLWREQDYEKGQAALAKIAATPEERMAVIPTELEKDFFRAVDILYGEGKKKERDIAYSKFMGELYEKYPGNQEIASFYALSCLGASRGGRDDAAFEKGADIVKGVLAENPNHPGALHYLIHSYDDPYHAHMALDAANSYSKVAADAEHALHMPSHIYVAVGMWDEVVNSNIRSYSASVNRMEAKGLDNDARGYHAFHWLQYGYLQQGKYEEARKIIADTEKYVEELPSKRARTHLLRMKGNYLVETNEWDSEVANIEIDLDKLNIIAKSIYHWIEGRKAFHQKDAAALAETIKTMEALQVEAAQYLTDEGVPMCSAGSNRYAPNEQDLKKAKVFELQLRGLESWLKGDDMAVENWFNSAITMQETTSYMYGPPVIIKPSFELYGEFLLEKGQYEKAKQMYADALERGPRRVAAMKGKIAALENLKEAEEMATLAKDLGDILKNADEGVSGRQTSMLEKEKEEKTQL